MLDKNKKRDILAMHGPLWADQYAVTMSQAFFANNKHEQITTFHSFIRKNPFDGGYLITAGQNIVFDWLNNWKFDKDDIDFLKKIEIPNPETGEMVRLYSDDFLKMLKESKLELTVDAMPEGELAFPDEPIFRIKGPLWQCLMVEAAILNIMNSQSLFATLASRLVEVAEGAPILEFGLRRAQSLGGLESSRGSYIGGSSSTSNMLAGKYYGIPTSGTFAHALVMVYEDELEAFRDYAGAVPYNGIFLVDTYDTLEGVKKAIQACIELGVTMKGIRLDSGDLAYLSSEARKILDDAGFKDAKIAASNDLDEETISSLKKQGAKIDIWGIGTNLATSKSQPALGGVYKLGAVYKGDVSQNEIDKSIEAIRKGKKSPEDIHKYVRDVIKISEQQIKTTIPGELDVLRYLKKEDGKLRFDGDTIISNLDKDPISGGKLNRDILSIRKIDETLRETFNKGTNVYRPIKQFFKNGKLIGKIETVHQAKIRAKENLSLLDKTHKRLINPHLYVTGLEEKLFNKRRKMILGLRKK